VLDKGGPSAPSSSGNPNGGQAPGHQ
jgi:hypothetical protein